jgi:uroporphyrinogen decarboxylase
VASTRPPASTGTSTGDRLLHPLTGRERILRACRGEPVDVIPIWLMRQAGRYLPEYRALRERADFVTLIKTPELAAEISLQPLKRFPLDAAIVFSDILVMAEPMGLRVTFDPAPVVSPPLRSRADIERLRAPENGEGLEYTPAAIRELRLELAGKTAIIGFAGAPLTVAGYLCGGERGRPADGSFTAFRRLLHADPGAAHRLLEKLARVTAGYLVAQVEAGADLVQLFDTWAGLLDPADYRSFGLPYVSAIIDTLHRRHVPVIYFARGASGLLAEMEETGADVLSVDWTLDLAAVRSRLGSRPVQGNLDPALLLAPPDVMEARAHLVLAAGGGSGHIFNLGHGVPPETSPDQVARLVEIVHHAAPPPVGLRSNN